MSRSKEDRRKQREMDLSGIADDEFDAILNVIQRDIAIREAEKHRLTSKQQEVSQADHAARTVRKLAQFTANHCMRCFCEFYVLFNPKYVCFACHYNVCKKCCALNKKINDYLCNVCDKEKDILLQKCDWFYDAARRRFKHFGSAKVVRALHKASATRRRSMRLSPSHGSIEELQLERRRVRRTRSIQYLCKLTRVLLTGTLQGIDNENDAQSDTERSTRMSLAPSFGSRSVVDGAADRSDARSMVSSGGIRDKTNTGLGAGPGLAQSLGDLSRLSHADTNGRSSTSSTSDPRRAKIDQIRQLHTLKFHAQLSTLLDELNMSVNTQFEKYREAKRSRGQSQQPSIVNLFGLINAPNLPAEFEADKREIEIYQNRIELILSRLVQSLYVAFDSNSSALRLNDQEIRDLVRHSIIEEVQSFLGRALVESDLNFLRNRKHTNGSSANESRNYSGSEDSDESGSDDDRNNGKLQASAESRNQSVQTRMACLLVTEIVKKYKEADRNGVNIQSMSKAASPSVMKAPPVPLKNHVSPRAYYGPQASVGSTNNRTPLKAFPDQKALVDVNAYQRSGSQSNMSPAQPNRVGNGDSSQTSPNSAGPKFQRTLSETSGVRNRFSTKTNVESDDQLVLFDIYNDENAKKLAGDEDASDDDAEQEGQLVNALRELTELADDELARSPDQTDYVNPIERETAKNAANASTRQSRLSDSRGSPSPSPQTQVRSSSASQSPSIRPNVVLPVTVAKVRDSRVRVRPQSVSDLSKVSEAQGNSSALIDPMSRSLVSQKNTRAFNVNSHLVRAVSPAKSGFATYQQNDTDGKNKTNTNTNVDHHLNRFATTEEIGIDQSLTDDSETVVNENTTPRKQEIGVQYEDRPANQVETRKSSTTCLPSAMSPSNESRQRERNDESDSDFASNAASSRPSSSASVMWNSNLLVRGGYQRDHDGQSEMRTNKTGAKLGVSIELHNQISQDSNISSLDEREFDETRHANGDFPQGETQKNQLDNGVLTSLMFSRFSKSSQFGVTTASGNTTRKLSVFEGESAVIVSSIAEAGATVTWHKIAERDGKFEATPVDQSSEDPDKFELETEHDGKSSTVTLRVNFVSKHKDSGCYIAVLDRNGVGITPEDLAKRLIDAVELVVLPAQIEFKPPSFVDQFTTIDTPPSASVDFHCKLVGSPVPIVRFLKDGRPMQFVNNRCNNVILTQVNARTYRLTIENVSEQDDAEYGCYARNCAGTARCAAMLNVRREDGRGRPSEGTDALERAFERLRQTQSDVTEEAIGMRNDALRLSRIEQQLNQLDQSLAVSAHDITSFANTATSQSSPPPAMPTPVPMPVPTERKSSVSDGQLRNGDHDKRGPLPMPPAPIRLPPASEPPRRANKTADQSSTKPLSTLQIVKQPPISVGAAKNSGSGLTDAQQQIDFATAEILTLQAMLNQFEEYLQQNNFDAPAKSDKIPAPITYERPTYRHESCSACAYDTKSPGIAATASTSSDNQVGYNRSISDPANSYDAVSPVLSPGDPFSPTGYELVSACPINVRPINSARRPLSTIATELTSGDQADYQIAYNNLARSDSWQSLRGDLSHLLQRTEMTTFTVNAIEATVNSLATQMASQESPEPVKFPSIQQLRERYVKSASSTVKNEQPEAAPQASTSKLSESNAQKDAGSTKRVSRPISAITVDIDGRNA